MSYGPFIRYDLQSVLWCLTICPTICPTIYPTTVLQSMHTIWPTICTTICPTGYSTLCPTIYPTISHNLGYSHWYDISGTIVLFLSLSLKSDDIMALLAPKDHKVPLTCISNSHRRRVMDIKMLNFRHIDRHLVFCSSNSKSEDIIAFLDLENHKVDTNIGSLAVTIRDITISITNFRHIGRHLVFVIVRY